MLRALFFVAALTLAACDSPKESAPPTAKATPENAAGAISVAARGRLEERQRTARARVSASKAERSKLRATAAREALPRILSSWHRDELKGKTPTQAEVDAFSERWQQAALKFAVLEVLVDEQAVQNRMTINQHFGLLTALEPWHVRRESPNLPDVVALMVERGGTWFKSFDGR